MAKVNYKVIGLGEMAATKDPGAGVKTHALGSCVGVVAVDASRKIVGMVHVVLPDSSTNPDHAKESPGYFADTALPEFFDMMIKAGAASPAQLKIHLMGGAKVIDGEDSFNIGGRNQEAVKAYLSKQGYRVAAEDLGGKENRTVAVDTTSLKVMISRAGQSWESGGKAPAPKRSAHKGPLKILVADDSAMMRKAVVRQIEAWANGRPFTLIQSEDGNQAMSEINKPGLALAVLDIEMGGPSGLEVGRIAIAKGVKTIINSSKVTVLDTKGYRDMAKEIGVDALLMKSEVGSKLQPLLTEFLG